MPIPNRFDPFPDGLCQAPSCRLEIGMELGRLAVAFDRLGDHWQTSPAGSKRWTADDRKRLADIVHLFDLLPGASALNARGHGDTALTPREVEVLRWIARGKSNTVIAQILGISRHTVDTHNRRIYRKLGAGDRITATVRAMEAGLLDNAPVSSPSD